MGNYQNKPHNLFLTKEMRYNQYRKQVIKMESSLGRMQKTIIKLEKDNTRLRDLLAVQKEKNEILKKQIKNLESTMEEKIKATVEKVCEELIIKIANLEEENAKLKSILNNTSENSGIPTSKTPIGKEKRVPNSREKSEKKKGGQEGHKKHKLERFADNEITDTYIHELTSNKCKCGGMLLEIGKREKDEFDIQIRVMKIRHEFLEYKCEKCNKEIKVPIPDNLKEENQYGSNVQAIAVSLINEGCVSFHRTRELINGFSNGEMNISEGYLAKLQLRCYKKLEEFENELHKEILKQKLLYWDDTAISIDKKQACLRFYGDEKLAYYKAHERKNKEGIDADNILKVLSEDTVVMHDHNIVNYNEDYNFTNAECCVHLLRDLKKQNEKLPRQWIDEMENLFVDTNKKRNEYITDNIMMFDQMFTDKIEEKYDEIIENAKEINAKDFNRYFGNDEKTLINRLINYKENYLLWIIRFDVPFSNNLSERSLRSSKTKMKVSGQFSNINYAQYYARIKSYIETAKRNGLNPHVAIEKLLEDNPYQLNDMLKKD